jgi:hypothetical protein
MHQGVLLVSPCVSSVRRLDRREFSAFGGHLRFVFVFSRGLPEHIKLPQFDNWAFSGGYMVSDVNLGDVFYLPS